MVDVFVYTYDYGTREWEENSKSIGLPNNVYAVVQMGRLQKIVLATCIHVTVGQVNKKVTSFNKVYSISFKSRYMESLIVFSSQ